MPSPRPFDLLVRAFRDGPQDDEALPSAMPDDFDLACSGEAALGNRRVDGLELEVSNRWRHEWSLGDELGKRIGLSGKRLHILDEEPDGSGEAITTLVIGHLGDDNTPAWAVSAYITVSRDSENGYAEVALLESREDILAELQRTHLEVATRMAKRFLDNLGQLMPEQEPVAERAALALAALRNDPRGAALAKVWDAAALGRAWKTTPHKCPARPKGLAGCNLDRPLLQKLPPSSTSFRYDPGFITSRSPSCLAGATPFFKPGDWRGDVRGQQSDRRSGGGWAAADL